MRFTPRPRWPLAVLLVAPVLVASRPAAAAANDAAASKLRQDAIYQDYLATRFDDAPAKLLKALALCAGAPDCTATTRAHLHCDLGVIDFALQRPDDGRAEFAEAVKQDPTVALDHDLSTPALERAFAAAGGRPYAAEAKAAAPTGVKDTGGQGAGGQDAGPLAPGAADGPDAPDAPKGSAARQGSDCPPGFPGCAASDRPEKDEEPDEAQARPDAPFKRSWVSVAFQAEALLLPTASNACSGGSGYACFNGSTYYAAKPLAGADDVVDGGVRLGTKRVLLGYDRAIGANFTLGGRIGFVFGGGPTRPGGRSFDPVHLEGRASYWFGHDPLARAGLRFNVTAALGLAEVDATVPADVFASTAAYQAGQSQNYDAWRKTGLGFGSLGLGAMFAFTPESGVVLEAKALEMFPTTGTALGVQLGYVIGL
jgi:hypothetical protein